MPITDDIFKKNLTLNLFICSALSRLLIGICALFYGPLTDSTIIPLTEAMAHFDSGWYQAIAEHGYPAQAHGRWAFFPLFPLLTRLLPLSFTASALIFNTIFFFISVQLLYRLITLRADNEAAAMGTLLFIFSPYSFYLSAPYSEALYICLSLLVFYFAAQKKWLWALVFAPFLSASRNSGVFMVFPLGLLALEQYGLKAIFSFKKRTLPAWFTLLILPAGLFIYMRAAYISTGDAFIFATVQSYWNKLSLSEGLRVFIPNLLSPKNIKELYHSLFVWLGLFFTVFLVKKGRYSEAVWLLLSYMFASVTGTFSSMARYVMMGSFSLYLAFGLFMHYKFLKPWFILVVGSFALMLGFFTSMWIGGFNLA
jgi:hypothetical protein